ncbi:hypothetical protein AgCh_010177 [Apium graveolens]
MALGNPWFPPEMGLGKINVHRIVDEDEDMQGVQSQVWVIHLAMKLTKTINIPHVHIDIDNIGAFHLLNDENGEDLERGDITVVVQQINVLHAEYNRVLEDRSQPRSCKIIFVVSTSNRVPLYLVEYGLRNFNGFVGVPHPFNQFGEILDHDNGHSSHLPSFDI